MGGCGQGRAEDKHKSFLYPSLSSRPLAALLGGGEVSMGSWPGLSPREEACPGLESELSWEVSWLDMEEPEGRMGALLNRAGEKSLQRKSDSECSMNTSTTVRNMNFCFIYLTSRSSRVLSVPSNY